MKNDENRSKVRITFLDVKIEGDEDGALADAAKELLEGLAGRLDPYRRESTIDVRLNAGPVHAAGLDALFGNKAKPGAKEPEQARGATTPKPKPAKKPAPKK